MVTSAHADEAAVLDKDFHTMMAWFPGVYDNQDHFYFEQELEVDEALRYERIHHFLSRWICLLLASTCFMCSNISTTTQPRYIASAFTPLGPTTKRARFA